MILAIYILTELWLKLKLSNHDIGVDCGTFKGSMAPMVDLVMYGFIYLETGKITPEKSFTNGYIEAVYKWQHIHTSTKRLHVILYAKCKTADLNRVMKNQYQYLTETQRNEFLKWLQKTKDLFNGTLGT